MVQKLILTQFQQAAVESGVAVLRQAQALFDAAPDEASRRATAAHNGCLLIEAPTGSGKTLMAGQIVETFSARERVVWSWFAPFKGVVGQSKAFLADQFAGLRLRELTDDRSVEESAAGDIFVTTWQTVATRVLDRRNVRKETESQDSVDLLVAKLRERGFRIGVVVKEPDAGLLALANDMSREVLVFKMAVALGFDAPRAYTLVSMRATRDPDFGVQLVGRILRVHRRLQAAARKQTLPDRLRYGYVFLADPATQEGLDIAGQRINQVQTEYAKVCGSTVILRIGDALSVQHAPDGQPVLFPDTVIPEAIPARQMGADGVVEPYGGTFALTFDFARFGGDDAAMSDADVTARIPPTDATGRQSLAYASEHFRYPLRSGVPRRFKTVVAMADNEVTEEDCANRFVVSARELIDAIAGRINIQRRTLEVFTHQLEFDFVGAALDPAEMARRAEKQLLASTMFDAKALRELLERKVATTLRELALEQADDSEAVARFLDTLLARHPELLRKAQRAAIAATLEVRMAEPLPENLASNAGLATSARNVYGVYPDGLNTWEHAFAKWLDGDTLGVVEWWHRNPSKQPWSVNVPLPDGRGFFPDFVVGISGRRTENGILLTDPKWGFDRMEEAPKAGAHHPAYGHVLVLYRDQDARWLTVRYDAACERAYTKGQFLLSDAAGYGL